MRIPAGLALAAAAAALLAPGPAAEGGEGFLVRRPLHVVPASGETGAAGGIEAWLRVTNGHRVLQGFSVWFRGLSDAEGATLWMALEGETELEEVVAIPAADDGSGLYVLRSDSSWENPPELPLAVETVLKLEGARVEVRAPLGGAEDVPVLRGSIGDFRFGDVEGRGNPSVRSRKVALEEPPPPALHEDDGARGFLRSFRRKSRGGAEPAFSGFSVYASGLTEDELYEVWIQTDPSDPETVEYVGLEFTTTADGLGFFSFDTRSGDILPAELDADDVRDLSGRRLEVRRTGYADASLVGIFPRLR